jgi:hypothetical protein
MHKQTKKPHPPIWSSRPTTKEMEMTSAVKRYDLKQEGDYSQREGVMTEVSNGDWVSSDDYDTLDVECRRLRSIIKDATDSVKEALSHLTEA